MIQSLAPATLAAWFSLFRRKARFWIDIVTIIRLNGLVVLALMVVSIAVLAGSGESVSSFFDRLTFFNTLALVLGVILAFYIAAIIVPYLYFLVGYYVIRRRRNQILFKFPSESCVAGEPFVIDAIVQKKMRLIFGMMKFRLVFFNYDTTDWYYLLQNQRRKGQLFNSTDRGAIGSFSLMFRHLGRFRTRYSVIKFEDPFGFFSLPIVEKEYHPTDRELNFHLYSLPKTPVDGTAPWYVKKTNVPAASEQKFKVAEDFFDSKRYEPTDDSRRLMWKVYAKSRELLVRIPDRDSVIDADVDVHILFHHAWYSADTSLMHVLYDQYITDIASLFDVFMRQRALTLHLFTDCDDVTRYEDDPNLTREENLKRHLVSTYWHVSIPPAYSIERYLAARARSRERILVVHPGIRVEELPADLLPMYSGRFLLGTQYRTLLSSMDGRFHPLHTGGTPQLRSMLMRAEAGRLFRRLDGLAAGLRTHFREGVIHGDH